MTETECEISFRRNSIKQKKCNGSANLNTRDSMSIISTGREITIDRRERCSSNGRLSTHFNRSMGTEISPFMGHGDTRQNQMSRNINKQTQRQRHVTGQPILGVDQFEQSIEFAKLYDPLIALIAHHTPNQYLLQLRRSNQRLKQQLIDLFGQERSMQLLGGQKRNIRSVIKQTISHERLNQSTIPYSQVSIEFSQQHQQQEQQQQQQKETYEQKQFIKIENDKSLINYDQGQIKQIISQFQPVRKKIHRIDHINNKNNNTANNMQSVSNNYSQYLSVSQINSRRLYSTHKGQQNNLTDNRLISHRSNLQAITSYQSKQSFITKCNKFSDQGPKLSLLPYPSTHPLAPFRDLFEQRQKSLGKQNKAANWKGNQQLTEMNLSKRYNSQKSTFCSNNPIKLRINKTKKNSLIIGGANYKTRQLQVRLSNNQTHLRHNLGYNTNFNISLTQQCKMAQKREFKMLK